MKKLKSKINIAKLVLGLGLLALGIFMPAFISSVLFGVNETLTHAATSGQKVYLITASLRLVALNTLRALPHYLGIFLIMQSIDIEKKLVQIIKNAVLALILIPFVYFAIDFIFDIRYDFGVPAVLMILTVLLVDRVNLSMVHLLKSLMMLTLFILAIQFLDVMPGTSGFFGRGELAIAIKEMAEILDAKSILLQMNLLFVVIFAFSGIVLALQTTLESRLRRAQRDANESAERLADARVELLESRKNKEQQFLVHDLKAPLTSMRLFADMIQMNCDNKNCESCEACSGYISHIDGSMDYMNGLISEIMNSKAANVYEVSAVLRVFESQISPLAYNDFVTLSCECPEAQIKTNRTNFVRALINLADNAAHSIKHSNGSIKVSVSRREISEEPYVTFTMEDNGEGMNEETLKKIWDEGYSGRGSSGIGLLFVKEVTQLAGGRINFASKVGAGTVVTIDIPEYVGE